MAGSLNADRGEKDPILRARVETVKFLAEKVAQPVAVLDAAFRVVYTNNSGERVMRACTRPAPQRASSSGSQVVRIEPCEACPSREVFNTGDRSGSISCDEGRDKALPYDACPFSFAAPLTGSGGHVGYVLLTGKEQIPEFAQITRRKFLQSRPEELTQAPSCFKAEKLEEDLASFEVLGESPAMEKVFRMIHLAAGTEATVLIQGESGTGKELVAKTLHRLSRRRSQPFVVVDCGSLPETLLESELFGHVRGAFTGAFSSRKGLFEEADGGTIFLDEIADISPTFQAKLLRVLQEGEIRPVGSSRVVKVNVRVLSASNQSLTQLVEAKAFRADLYFRLAVLPISLPPLRERREDIPILVAHFVETACRRNGKDLLTVSREAMQALVDSPWPGNVRELGHCLERAVITASGPTIGVEHLGSKVSAPQTPPRSLWASSRQATAQVERARILEALKETGGRKSQAARLLKISRASLYNKLKLYEIS